MNKSKLDNKEWDELLKLNKMLERDLNIFKTITNSEEYSKAHEKFEKELDKKVPKKSSEELNAMSLREYFDYIKARYD